MTLSVGDQAPDISLPNSHGETMTLGQFRGQWVVIYFYPKDHTSGCTKEACDFRDQFPDFTALNAVVLGISRDAVKTHSTFQEKHALPFHLLSDESGKTCQDYGVWVEKSMYGRKYFGIERSTFLIDKEGKIAKIWSKVKVPGHVTQVLDTLKS